MKPSAGMCLMLLHVHDIQTKQGPTCKNFVLIHWVHFLSESKDWTNIHGPFSSIKKGRFLETRLWWLWFPLSSTFGDWASCEEACSSALRETDVGVFPQRENQKSHSSSLVKEPTRVWQPGYVCMSLNLQCFHRTAHIRQCFSASFPANWSPPCRAGGG